MFDPEALIRRLPELVKQIDIIRAHLADEAEEVVECWEGLGRAGGQRADHAAELMSRLRPHLADLENFSHTCHEQITAMLAAPFADVIEPSMS